MFSEDPVASDRARGVMFCPPNVGLSCKPRKQAERPDRDALRSAGDCQIQARVGLRLGRSSHEHALSMRSFKRLRLRPSTPL